MAEETQTYQEPEITQKAYLAMSDLTFHEVCLRVSRANREWLNKTLDSIEESNATWAIVCNGKILETGHTPIEPSIDRVRKSSQNGNRAYLLFR